MQTLLMQVAEFTRLKKLMNACKPFHLVKLNSEKYRQGNVTTKDFKWLEEEPISNAIGVDTQKYT